MNITLLIFLVLLISMILFSVKRKKLTTQGVIVAALLSIIIFSGTGFPGIALLGSFFIMGVAATSWNRQQQKFHAKENEQRTAAQVMANGGLAAILSLIALTFPDYQPILLLLVACTFSSATADTISSELGMIYGKQFYNILTLAKDEKGENGVISFEGTIIGIIGSTIIAVVHAMTTEFYWGSFIVIIIAGTAGNIADSLLGATLERKNIIGNNTVNFLNTFIAAAVGGLISY